jgi:sugar O-acyltransferase (sialic acid O-acetyltransferase NeuD family)
MKNIILVGYDQDVIDLILSLDYEIVGYTSNKPKAHSSYNYLGNILKWTKHVTDCSIIVTCDDLQIRKYCMQNYADQLGKIVSPLAYVSSNSSIGRGSIVLPFAYIGSNSIIGALNKISVGARIHHGASTGSCTVIAPGATMLGNSAVGSFSFIGANATIRENTKVGSWCVIGMSSCVTKCINDNSTAYGNPCRNVYCTLPDSTG